MERKVYRLRPAVSAGGFGVPTKSDPGRLNPTTFFAHGFIDHSVDLLFWIPMSVFEV